MLRVPCKLVYSNGQWMQPSACPGRGLSPEQSAVTLIGVEVLSCISHKTHYSAIYAMLRNELCNEVIALLRKNHKSRRPRTCGKNRRGLIPNTSNIDERSMQVSKRLVLSMRPANPY